MSVSSVGGQSASLMQLMHQKRTAMQSLMSSVSSGDMTSAQASATTVQSDQSQIDSLIGTSNSTSQSSGFRATMKGDLSNLLTAVQSGDQSKASAALDQLKTDRASGPGKAGNDGDGDDNKTGGATGTPNALTTDLKGMLTALISGDTSGAASFASALQTDVGKLLGTTSTSSTSTDTSSTSSTSSTTSSSGNFLADLKALVGAVQSGDATATQSDASTLAGDVTSTKGAEHHGGHHHHGSGGAPPPDANSNSNSVQSILSLLQSVAKQSAAATTTSAQTQALAA